MDFACYALTVAAVVYWILWMAGCRLPGVGEAEFRGWRHVSPPPVREEDGLLPTPLPEAALRPAASPLPARLRRV